MTELEIMQRAKLYIDQLANGINPIDGTSVADTDVINNVRISRCLFYVSDILKQVIDNGGSVSKKKTAKSPFFLPSEAVNGFRFSKAPITVSEIVKRINSLADSALSQILCKRRNAVKTEINILPAAAVNPLSPY